MSQGKTQMLDRDEKMERSLKRCESLDMMMRLTAKKN